MVRDELSIGDQRVVNRLFAARPVDGFRFQDLIVAAIRSEVFLAKEDAYLPDAWGTYLLQVVPLWPEPLQSERKEM